MKASAVLILLFVAAVVIFYPATYAIDDECNILSLATALAHGTVFLDQANIDLGADLIWRGHAISKFSPFHAALIVPAILTSWRLAFAINPLFLIWGAAINRSMLREHGVPLGWNALYFLNPGLLYYSRTLLAIVPASVFALLGASLLYRSKPRPATAAAALSAAALMHIWLLPLAITLAGGWLIESGRSTRNALWLAIGALPGVAALAAYNVMTTGSPLRNAYAIIGHQRAFTAEHVWSFSMFYFVTLAVVPLGGLAVFVKRWAGGWTLPLTAGVVAALASLYYYRDGLHYGIAGWVPGERFLLPVSLLACLPAARFLASRVSRFLAPPRAQPYAFAAAAVVFTIGFTALSALHQSYLRAQLALQSAVRASIPEGAVVTSHDAAFKAFAPVNGRWVVRLVRYEQTPGDAEKAGTYVVWLGAPGQRPPAGWFDNRRATHTALRSWVWNRDLWVAAPPKEPGA